MFDKQYFKETFSQVHASDELLTEVLNMATHNNQNKTGRHGHLGRTLLIAAVLLCALTVTAVAAAGAVGITGDVSDALESFFGNSGEYAEHAGVVKYDEMGKLENNMPGWCREPLDADVANRLVAPYLYTLEKNTFSKGGYTYTLHSILWDSNTGANMIYWSVENPDGLGDYRVGQNGEFVRLESSRMYAVIGGRSYIDTINSTDTKLYLSAYDVDWQEEMWCELGVRESIHEQPDTVRQTIPRSDRGGMKAVTVDNMTLSPIAIRFEGVEESAVLDELVILFADGAEYVVFSEDQFVDNSPYGLDASEGYVTYLFNRIVDVEQVTAIVVNGEIYPIA